jgi:hypothetical protein
MKHIKKSIVIIKTGPIGRIHDPLGTQKIGQEILMANNMPRIPTISENVETCLVQLITIYSTSSLNYRPLLFLYPYIFKCKMLSFFFNIWSNFWPYFHSFYLHFILRHNFKNIVCKHTTIRTVAKIGEPYFIL